MAASVENIGASNQGDAFYRYKMPSLQARVRRVLVMQPSVSLSGFLRLRRLSCSSGLQISTLAAFLTVLRLAD